ncbi:MAG: hypothetical protein IJN92_05870 [Lachnospiraceae bacterium]|nr:hypothetical protein [Lachnospiraceae bacterium]
MIFKCVNCGGNVIYSPEKAGMYCPYCDSDESGEKAQGAGFTCISCGAPLEVEEFTSACKCKYCGSYSILEERVEGEFTPHLVLPFKVGKKQAKEKIVEQFKKKRFIPSDFLSEAKMEKMEGNYVPFFMYDYDCKYHYEGIGKKVRVWRSGNTEYTETSLYKVERNMDVDFAGIPVDASKGMKDDMMDLLEPYDYQALEQFQDKYLSGFLSERYNMGSEELSIRAREKAKKDAESMIKSTLTAYQSVKTESDEANLSLKDTKYSLLPVWSYLYEYGGKKYEFHLNGQTGKLVGEPPISTKKVVAYSTTTFLGVFAILNFLRMILEVI